MAAVDAETEVVAVVAALNNAAISAAVSPAKLSTGKNQQPSIQTANLETYPHAPSGREQIFFAAAACVATWRHDEPEPAKSTWRSQVRLQASFLETLRPNYKKIEAQVRKMPGNFLRCNAEIKAKLQDCEIRLGHSRNLTISQYYRE